MTTVTSFRNSGLAVLLVASAGGMGLLPTVSAQPRILLTNVLVLPGGGVQLQAQGPAGMVYSLQISRDLQGWRTLDFALAEGGTALFQDNAPGSATTRFYRVRSDVPQANVGLTNYHGWTNSLFLSNGVVAASIVPTVGRIMQFRFLDQADGPFFENSALFGRQPAANSWDTAGSFGGDKVWPAPQSVWNWPPPRGFDSMSFTGVVANGTVTMTGPVDPTFGIRVVRRIMLHPIEPILRVSSTFEKLTGRTNVVGVWTITQVREAERVFMPVPSGTLFTNNYISLGTVPKGTVVTNGLVSLSRDPGTGCKIGNDAGALLWVGTNSALLIESPRLPGVSKSGYPDSGCSAEVYTNPNPTAYIELELLGPVARLGTNDTLTATSIYTLMRRTQPNVDQEARIMFGDRR